MLIPTHRISTVTKSVLSSAGQLHHNEPGTEQFALVDDDGMCLTRSEMTERTAAVAVSCVSCVQGLRKHLQQSEVVNWVRAQRRSANSFNGPATSSPRPSVARFPSPDGVSGKMRPLSEFGITIIVETDANTSYVIQRPAVGLNSVRVVKQGPSQSPTTPLGPPASARGSLPPTARGAPAAQASAASAAAISTPNISGSEKKKKGAFASFFSRS